MQRIQPEIFLNRDTTGSIEVIHSGRTVLVRHAVARGIRDICGLWVRCRVFKDLTEECIGIELEHCSIRIGSTQVCSKIGDVLVEIVDISTFQVNRALTIDGSPR